MMQAQQVEQSQKAQNLKAAGLWYRTASTDLTGKSCGACCGATAVRALQALLVRLSGFYPSASCPALSEAPKVLHPELCSGVFTKTSFDDESAVLETLCGMQPQSAAALLLCCRLAAARGS